MTSNGGADMNILPPKGRMEWNFNTAVTIIGLLASFGASMVAGGIAYNSIVSEQKVQSDKLSDERTARERRGVSTDARFSAIEQKIPQFEVIGMQIQRLTELSAANAKAIDATNERLTRIVESQSGKLDAIIRSVSDLTTEVRVIQSQIKEQDRAQRTRYNTTVPSELRMK